MTEETPNETTEEMPAIPTKAAPAKPKRQPRKKAPTQEATKASSDENADSVDLVEIEMNVWDDTKYYPPLTVVETVNAEKAQYKDHTLYADRTLMVPEGVAVVFEEKYGKKVNRVRR